MSKLPENGVLHWLVRPTERRIEAAGFVRSDRSGALVLRGPTGTHLTGHGEGWRAKWEELARQGFQPLEPARAAGVVPASWQPPRLRRKERRLLAAHLGTRTRRRSPLLNRLPFDPEARGSRVAAWARIYGEEELAAVEEFLGLVCQAMLLERSDWRYLSPEDKPVDIYRANYGGDRPERPDTLEWPHFRQALEDRYRLSPPDTLPILSLAEIYALVRAQEDSEERR